MTSSSESHFKRNYQTHLKHLKLKGLQPKTIEAYAPAIRRVGEYLDEHIDDLSETQLADYFTNLLASHPGAQSNSICTTSNSTIPTCCASPAGRPVPVADPPAHGLNHSGYCLTRWGG